MTAIPVYNLEPSHQNDDSNVVIQQIAGIERSLFAHEAWSAAQINSLLENNFNRVIYAVDESKKVLVGYCMYNQLFEDAEILKIGTHPDYQRQGVASQLLNVMRQTLRLAGAERILLEVREDNLSAIAFYNRHGFEQIALRKNYYDNHDNTRTHALIMQHILNTDPCSTI